MLSSGVNNILRSIGRQTQLSNHLTRIGWPGGVPSVAPLFKINVDGVVFAPQRAVDVGVIIRNEEGEVIAALSKKIK